MVEAGKICLKKVVKINSTIMIIRNFVWQNLGDGKCSSEGKGHQKI